MSRCKEIPSDRSLIYLKWMIAGAYHSGFRVSSFGISNSRERREWVREGDERLGKKRRVLKANSEIFLERCVAASLKIYERLAGELSTLRAIGLFHQKIKEHLYNLWTRRSWEDGKKSSLLFSLIFEPIFYVVLLKKKKRNSNSRKTKLDMILQPKSLACVGEKTQKILRKGQRIMLSERRKSDGEEKYTY